jgi:hypothetical protein
VNSVRDNARINKADVMQIIIKLLQLKFSIHYNKNKKHNAHKKTPNNIIDTPNQSDWFAFAAT